MAFTEVIEPDGDGLTDAFLTRSYDLVFVFARDDAGAIGDASVLESVLGADGLTRERLEEALVDLAFQFDEDDTIPGVVEQGDAPMR